MNPLDRSLTPTSPQPEAQASSSQQADSSAQASSSLQANIANVGVAGTSQPVTMAIPFITSAPQFIPDPAYPDLVRSPEGDLFYVFNFFNQQAMATFTGPNLTLVSEGVAQQIDEHSALLDGIYIPVFDCQLRTDYIVSRNRLLLQGFIKKVLTRLEGLKCHYNRPSFISSLLMMADRNYRGYQNQERLKSIIGTYISNPDEGVYAQTNMNIDWPHSQLVRETQDLRNPHVSSVTPEIKKDIYLKMKELDSAEGQRKEDKVTKRIYHIDAAFAYGAPPGALPVWITAGKKFYNNQLAAEQPPEVAEELARADERPSSALEQAQASALNLEMAADNQRPGPSRSARASPALRFEPYPRLQPASRDLSSPKQVEALGLSAEAFQEFNLGTELDAEFNAQMAALSWPNVILRQFVQEQGSGRYIIAPATRMEIGRFIVESCPADSRVYKYAALRYGVSLTEIVKWASEASE